jgi:hypothetical protein
MHAKGRKGRSIRGTYGTSNDSGENWQSEFELLDIGDMGLADVEATAKVGAKLG